MAHFGVAVDESGRLPLVVRQRLAVEVKDPTTEVGQALYSEIPKQVQAAVQADPNIAQKAAEAAAAISAQGVLAPYDRFRSALMVGDGDSLTAASVDSIARVFADSWYTYLNAFSDGRVPYVFNAGHGGYTSAQLLALLDTEVIAKLPKGGRVVWAAGRNDQRVIANTKAADREVLARCRAAGIDVVFTTIPPVGATPLDTPATPTAAADTITGALAAGTYAYRIVARNAIGATLPSPAQSATLSAVGRVVLTWAHIHGATAYDIYRDGLKIATAATAANLPVPSYTDTGATGVGATPTTNTTGAAPGNAGDPYFTAQINAWRKRFAAENGVPCIDFYAVLADPTTGYYKKGYTTDGVHPTTLGQREMGLAAWRTLAASVPDARGYITDDQANPINGYRNGLFLVGGGNPIDRPSGFAGYGSTGLLRGGIGPLAGFKGNAWTVERLAANAPAYNGEIQVPIADFGVSVGDLIQLSLRASVIGNEAGGATAEMGVRFRGGTGLYLGLWRFSGAEVPDPTQLVGPPVVVPTGTTHLSLLVNLFGGTGKVATGQWTILNLTAASIAN